MKYIDLSKVNDTDKQLEVTSNIIDYPQQNVIESLSPIVLSILGFNTLSELDTTKTYVISGCDFTRTNNTVTSISSGYVLTYTTYSSTSDQKWLIVELIGTTIAGGIIGFNVNKITPTSPSLNPITYSGGTQDNIYYSLNVTLTGSGGTNISNIINVLNVFSNSILNGVTGTTTLSFDVKQTYNLIYSIGSNFSLAPTFTNTTNPDYRQRTSYINISTNGSSSTFTLLYSTTGYNTIINNKYQSPITITPNSPLTITITTLYYPSLSQYVIIVN